VPASHCQRRPACCAPSEQTFVVGFASVATAFMALSLVYGSDVEYRFEAAAISVAWTVLIVAATLLAIGYWTERQGLSA
jgi:hypothetical protein